MEVKEKNDYLLAKIAGSKAIFTKRHLFNFSRFLEMNQETIFSFIELEKLFEKENENIDCLYVPNAEHTNSIVILEKCMYYKMVQYNNITLKMPKPLCDGIITKDNTKSLVVFPGDCIVVAGIDKETGTRFILHAGWRGVSLDIAKNMAIELQKLGVALKNMEIIIFPSISREFLTLDEKNAQSFQTYREMRWNEEIGQYNIDLVSILKSQLTDEGFCKNNILEMSYCTYSASDKNGYMFNSYRRDKSIQRNAAILTGAKA
jgi:hypothetical protein